MGFNYKAHNAPATNPARYISAIGGHLPRDFDFWRFDLEHFSHAALRTGIILTKFELAQLHSVFLSYNIFTADTLNHAVALTFDLMRSICIGCHVIKL